MFPTDCVSSPCEAIISRLKVAPPPVRSISDYHRPLCECVSEHRQRGGRPPDKQTLVVVILSRAANLIEWPVGPSVRLSAVDTLLAAAANLIISSYGWRSRRTTEGPSAREGEEDKQVTWKKSEQHADKQTDGRKDQRSWTLLFLGRRALGRWEKVAPPPADPSASVGGAAAV